MSAPKAPGIDIHHPTDLTLPGDEIQKKESQPEKDIDKRPATDEPESLDDIEP